MINAKPTIARRRLIQAGDMDKETCPQCEKILKPNCRGVFCGRRFVWRAWHQHSTALGYEAKNRPLAGPPLNSDPRLPEMGQRLRVADQFTLLARALADARCYRVGNQPGNQQLIRWFPLAPFRAPAMFLPDPFEAPAVPVQGTYAVAYFDGRGLPLGGHYLTPAVEQIDRAPCADRWRPDLQAATWGGEESLDLWSVRPRSTSCISRAAPKVQGVSDRFPSLAVQGGTTPVMAQCEALGS